MLDDIKKPSPPAASARSNETTDKSPNKPDRKEDINSISKFSIEKSSCIIEKSEKYEEKMGSGTLERRIQSIKSDKVEGSDVLIAQLNDRVSLWFVRFIIDNV